jgi:diguanylate cyclase (GGDEF)-like protein
MPKRRKDILKTSGELERLKRELEEANRKLEVCSRTDALTGVLNRLVFESVLKAEWQRCRRYLIPLSLILVDVDFFAAFNGHYGQKAGDDCLKRVADALKSCARRSSDTVSRYSGDEFAILVPHLKKDYAFVLAGLIRDKIASLCIPHAGSPVSEHLTASIGIHTTVPDDQLSIPDYIRVAEIALLEAKKEHNSIIIE